LACNPVGLPKSRASALLNGLCTGQLQTESPLKSAEIPMYNILIEREL
jgi:hypothetical protein